MTFLEYFKNLQQKVYVTVAQLESGIGTLDSNYTILPRDFGERIYGAFFRYSYPAPQFSYFSIAENIVDTPTAASAVQNVFDFEAQNSDPEQNIEIANKIATAIFNIRGNQAYDLFNNLEYANKNMFAFRNVSLSDYQSSYLKVPIAYKLDTGELHTYLDSILISFYYTVDMDYYSYYERQPSGSGLLFIWRDIINELKAEITASQASTNTPTNSKVINIASTAHYKKYHKISFDVFVTRESPIERTRFIPRNIFSAPFIRYKYEEATGEEEGVYIAGKPPLDAITEQSFIKATGDEILIKKVGENYCLTFYNYAYNKYDKEKTIHYVGEKFFSHFVSEIYYINIFPIFEICLEENNYIKANGDIKYTSIKLIGEIPSLYLYEKEQKYLNFYTGGSLSPDIYPIIGSLEVFDQSVNSGVTYQPPTTPANPPGGPIRPPVTPIVSQSSFEA